jgi:hypothetical protein
MLCVIKLNSIACNIDRLNVVTVKHQSHSLTPVTHLARPLTTSSHTGSTLLPCTQPLQTAVDRATTALLLACYFAMRRDFFLQIHNIKM